MFHSQSHFDSPLASTTFPRVIMTSTLKNFLFKNIVYKKFEDIALIFQNFATTFKPSF